MVLTVSTTCIRKFQISKMYRRLISKISCATLYNTVLFKCSFILFLFFYHLPCCSSSLHLAKQQFQGCCYITLDPATPAPWNGVSHCGVLLNRPRCLMLPSLNVHKTKQLCFKLILINTLFKTILFLDGLSQNRKNSRKICA